MDEYKNETIEGRNAVTEALRAGRALDKVFIARGETDRALAFVAAKARSAGVTVVECDRRKLDAMSVTKAHQGVIAVDDVVLGVFVQLAGHGLGRVARDAGNILHAHARVFFQKF